MCEIYDTICNIIDELNGLLWGAWTILLIFAAAIFLTIRLKGVQFRSPGYILRMVFAPDKQCRAKSQNAKKDKKTISRLQSLSTALGASMGTGNIIGVAAAISIGGSGSIIWMVISSFAVMSFAYAENVLGIKYKSKSLSTNGQMSVNVPMAYISAAFCNKRAGVFYAVMCLLASLGSGNSVQANSACLSAEEMGISSMTAGLILAAAVGISIFRGGKFAAAILEKTVPLFAGAYILCAAFVLVLYRNNITEILQEMVISAFGFEAASGGISGTVIKNSLTTGLRRGMFSNEAGMGSSVFAHAASDCDDPEVIGCQSIFEVFTDTVLCCVLTALVILCTGADTNNSNPAAVVIEAFEYGMGEKAGIFVSVSNIIFAFAAIIGWYFYGEKSVEFLFPKAKLAVKLYSLLYILTAYTSSFGEVKAVWAAADAVNLLMFLPNAAAVIILSGEAAEYVCRRKKR